MSILSWNIPFTLVLTSVVISLIDPTSMLGHWWLITSYRKSREVVTNTCHNLWSNVSVKDDIGASSLGKQCPCYTLMITWCIGDDVWFEFLLNRRNGIQRGTHNIIYHQVSNIRRNLVGDKIVDHSDVVGASPVGVTPTTSSFSTQHLASLYCAKTTASRDEKH